MWHSLDFSLTFCLPKDYKAKIEILNVFFASTVLDLNSNNSSDKNALFGLDFSDIV